MASLANTDIMFQTATYWGPGTNDGYGGYSYPAPVEISCRWEDQQDLFVAEDGRELRSVAVVYPDQVVANQGWLYLGSSAETDPHDVSGAHEIKAVRNIPDLLNELFEVKAWL